MNFSIITATFMILVSLQISPLSKTLITTRKIRILLFCVNKIGIIFKCIVALFYDFFFKIYYLKSSHIHNNSDNLYVTRFAIIVKVLFFLCSLPQFLPLDTLMTIYSVEVPQNVSTANLEGEKKVERKSVRTQWVVVRMR